MKLHLLLKKSAFFLVLIIGLNLIATAQNVAITDDDTYTAEQSAMLDVKSDDKGMLIPRVALVNQTDPIASAKAIGLLVWNTNTSGNYLSVGFYFWNGLDWEIIGGSLVEGNVSGEIDDPLFEVKNNNGQTVFAVYNEGVRIWVDDSDKKATGSRGGFAVGGISGAKGDTNEYLRVTPDSVRVYIDPAAGKAKGSRGGFAVGGISGAKGSSNWMVVKRKNIFIGENSGVNNIGDYNQFIGYQSGMNNTSGTFNQFIGYRSGENNTTGESNIFLGNYAGYLNDDGLSNIFIGVGAGQNSKSGNYNIFMGRASGIFNTDGAFNVFIGDWSGYKNNGGNYNTYIGFQSGLYAGNAGGDVFRNTFMGFMSGRNAYGGEKNTFLGYKAGYNNNGGFSNVYIGDSVGTSNTSGSNNTFIGSEVGSSNTTGKDNVFIGSKVGLSNTTGSYNVFLGKEAGNSNVSSQFNTYIGYQAGYNASGSSYNTAVGYQAGYSQTTWQAGTFLGFQAGKNTTGRQNVFLGSSAGIAFTTGGDNVCIGAGAGGSNDSPFVEATGTENIFIGYFTGYKCGSATHNLIVGPQTPYGDSYITGSYNVYLGEDAGNQSGSASNNVFIGYNAGKDEVNSNRLYIDNSDTSSPLIYGDFANDRLALNGNVGVNRGAYSNAALVVEAGTNGWGTYSIKGTSTNGYNYFEGNTAFGSSTANISSYALAVNGTAFVTSGVWGSSDKRWKKNITTIDSALEKIVNLRGVTFYWKIMDFPDRGFTDEKQVGVIAQEVEAILPELVKTDSDGYKSVSYDRFTVVLIEAVKEQQKQIEILKTQIIIQQKEVEELRADAEKNEDLQKQLDRINEVLNLKAKK